MMLYYEGSLHLPSYTYIKVQINKYYCPPERGDTTLMRVLSYRKDLGRCGAQ